MSYTPPAGNAANFNFTQPYAIPAGNRADFPFGLLPPTPPPGKSRAYRFGLGDELANEGAWFPVPRARPTPVITVTATVGPYARRPGPWQEEVWFPQVRRVYVTPPSGGTLWFQPVWFTVT